MKTLAEIKNQKIEEKLEILQKFIKGADENILEWVYEQADLGIGFEYAWENGHSLFYSKVDISKYSKSKKIDVYIAEHYNEDKDKYSRYYALFDEE